MVCKSILGGSMSKYLELERFLKDKNEKKIFIKQKIEFLRHRFAKYLVCDDARVEVKDIIFDKESFSFDLILTVIVSIPQLDPIEETISRNISGKYSEKIFWIYDNVEYPINEEEALFKLFNIISESFFIY